MGRGLCRHRESKQNGRHGFASEGMAAAIRTLAAISAANQGTRRGDCEIAKRFELFLQRARVFTVAGRPLLALEDAERAFKLQPASMRARIQTGEALLDTSRAEDAAKLQIGRLARDREDGHVSEQALLELSVNDALLAQNPKNVEALVARAGVLRSLRQLTLALADARAAIAVNEKSADAQFLAAHVLMIWASKKTHWTRARIATELDPNDPAKWSFRGVLERQRADFEAADSITNTFTAN